MTSVIIGGRRKWRHPWNLLRGPQRPIANTRTRCPVGALPHPVKRLWISPAQKLMPADTYRDLTIGQSEDKRAPASPGTALGAAHPSQCAPLAGSRRSSARQSLTVKAPLQRPLSSAA